MPAQRENKIEMKWLPDMDLNHDKQIQSLLCYRYTIGQTSAVKIGNWRAESRLSARRYSELPAGPAGEARSLMRDLRFG